MKTNKTLIFITLIAIIPMLMLGVLKNNVTIKSQNNVSISSYMLVVVHEDVDILDDSSDISPDCGVLSPGMYDLMQRVFDYIKIFAPLLLLTFGTYDFAKSVLASDADQMKKSQMLFLKRAIAAVGIFLLPAVLNLILDLAGLTGTCGIG